MPWCLQRASGGVRDKEEPRRSNRLNERWYHVLGGRKREKSQHQSGLVAPRYRDTIHVQVNSSSR